MAFDSQGIRQEPYHADAAFYSDLTGEVGNQAGAAPWRRVKHRSRLPRRCLA